MTLQGTIEELNNLINAKDIPIFYKPSLEHIKETIELELKEQKTGHWIEGQTNNSKIHNILCSNCSEGYPSKGHANSQYTGEKFKFCPNCGAKMKEKQNE